MPDYCREGANPCRKNLRCPSHRGWQNLGHSLVVPMLAKVDLNFSQLGIFHIVRPGGAGLAGHGHLCLRRWLLTVINYLLFAATFGLAGGCSL
jgi:hypothetical protein